MEGSLVEEKHAIRGEQEKVKEINLKALYTVIKRRIWLIALLTIVLTSLAGFYNARPEAPLYSASSRIMIVANAETMGTLRVMFREPIVMEKIAQELELNRSAAQLRSQIRVDSVEGSLITVVTAIDSNPKLAADIANTGVKAYKQVAAETLGISSIRVLSEAQENRNSINEKGNTLVYAAFIAGLVLGIGLALVLDSLDDSVRSKRDIEELLCLTMLGQVSRMSRKDYAKKSRKHKSIVARGETIGS